MWKDDLDKSMNSAIRTRNLNLWYATFQALLDVDLDIAEGRITALIGPSGCGKSTLLRSFNRINDRLDYVRITGSIEILGQDIFSPSVELVQLRKRVGMVFQRPNPLPLSIRDNILFGYRIHNAEVKLTNSQAEEVVQNALEQVLMWDIVKDRLGSPALSLSLEQQQRLCIARLLPVKPSILLMDEPCSALDPKSTEAVEDLLWELRGEYTIVIVTHNMAQARRASDECVFMLMGKMIEHSDTAKMFVTPDRPETADYIEGRFG